MRYFAYGMNTNLDSMSIRCPGAVSLGPAYINDHKFVFRVHADIEYSPGSKVWGVLWDINENDLRSLDRLEGYPHYYTRRKFKTHSKKLGMIKAIAYQMNNQKDKQDPSQGYFNMVFEGYKQNNVPIDQLLTIP